MDGDPAVAQRREPGRAGLDEVDVVAEPGEPDRGHQADVAGPDDRDRRFEGSIAPKGTSPSRSGPRRPRLTPPIRRGARPRCRLRPCASRSSGSRGSGTCRRSSPTRPAGVAAVVDPRRDVDVYLDAARAADVRITHVVETHLHNDYVSGGRELAALTGATHVIGAGAELAPRAPAGARRRDVRRRLAPVPDARHARAHARARRATPSPTPPRADEPFLLLTGGSLLVGAVGRTDLLGAENADAVRRARCTTRSTTCSCRTRTRSMVYPTHGAGSLCSTGIASTPWSTIGYERRHDPLLGPMEVDAFARALLAGQPTFPRYFARMRPINQAGPPLLGGAVPGSSRSTGEALDRALERGALLVDAPLAAAHAAGHVPGSLSIPAGLVVRDVARLGRRPDRPLVLLLDDADDWDDAVRQALRIGFEIDRRPRRRRDSRPGARPAGRSRPARCSTSTSWRGQLAAGARTRRSSSTSARRREYEAGHVPGCDPHQRRRPAGAARRAAARPPDRHDLRERLPLERRGLAAARGRLRARRRGRGRGPDLGGARLPGRRTAPRRRAATVRACDGGHAHGRGARPASRLSPPATPNTPSAATPSRTASSDDHQADRRPRPARSPSRPLRWLPISRRSLTSRTMNTRTTGSSRPCRFCEATMSGSRSRPGTSTTSAPATSTNV